MPDEDSRICNQGRRSVPALLLQRRVKPGLVAHSLWRNPPESGLVHRLISGRHTVGFKRVWMLGASEERIRCDP